MENLSHYYLFAELFKYPSIKLVDGAVKTGNWLATDYPEAAAELEKFVSFTLSTPLPAAEEIYLKTFHIQAICYLDLGYVIFGEDYKRGEFLANMKREQREAGNNCGDELADNLVNVLTLIPKLQNKEFLDELAGYILIPALEKMLNEFKPSKIALKTEILQKKHKAILQKNVKHANIYQYALKTLWMVIRDDFKDVCYKEAEQPSFNANPFISNCGSCSIPNTVYNHKMQ